MFGGLILATAVAITAVAAVTDSRTGRIPNWLTLPSFVFGLALHCIDGGLLALGHSLLSALVCGLVPYLLFRKGAAGGGDVKLLAALGALGGVTFGIEAQLCGLSIACFYALVRLTFQGALGRTLMSSLRIAVAPLTPRRYRRPVPTELMTPVRLGVPILLGTVVAVAIRYPLLGLGS